MSEYDYTQDGEVWDGVEPEPEVGYEVPVAEPDLGAGVGYAPQLTGEQLVAVASSLAATPQAQEFMAQAQAAAEAAERQETGPSIHSFLDSVEGKHGVTLDRRTVMDDAESILPALVNEYGASQETAMRALEIAARRNVGKETYDDVIARHVGRVRR